MMRILIISQYFWPESFRINDLANEMIARGHQVTVLTGWPNYPEGKIYPEFKRHPEKYTKLGSVDIVRVPLAARGKGGFSLFLNYLSFALSASFFGPIKMRKKEFDVIFVYEPSPITVGLPAIFFKFLRGTPIAFWVLDLWPETLSAVGVIKNAHVLRSVASVVRLIYTNCDLILAQSKSFIRAIEKYCAESKKISYFPSWSEELFGSEAVELASEVEKRDGIFNVLFAGNVGDAQDFPTILKAAALLRDRKDVRWIIVGDGRMAAWVKSEIERLDLTENIVMPGRFPLERMASFFLHADAVLVSLKPDEVFAMTIPGKVQTYLSSGIPIIGVLDGEGAQVIQEAQAGYTCNAGDADALAEAVRRMAALSPAQRLAMGRSGKLYYDAQFRKEFLMDALEGHFENLILDQYAAG
jgi:colanic acid biosynthesis glycosyl transferase WcaI